MIRRPALFDRYHIASCEELLVEELPNDELAMLDKIFGPLSEPPPIHCERRTGHPGSHYGEAENRQAMWDDEVVFTVSFDRGWASYMPRGNYHGAHHD